MNEAEGMYDLVQTKAEPEDEDVVTGSSHWNPDAVRAASASDSSSFVQRYVRKPSANDNFIQVRDDGEQITGSSSWTPDDAAAESVFFTQL